MYVTRKSTKVAHCCERARGLQDLINILNSECPSGRLTGHAAAAAAFAAAAAAVTDAAVVVADAAAGNAGKCQCAASIYRRDPGESNAVRSLYGRPSWR